MTGVCDGNTQPEVVQQKPRVCEIKPDGSEDCGKCTFNNLSNTIFCRNNIFVEKL